MKSIIIYYFSGTNNTKLVSEMFQDNFIKLGYKAKAIAIEKIMKKETALKLEKHDLIGFGHPVHAFSAPKFFFDFIDRLPKGKGKRVFLFKTSGDPLCNGGATSHIRKKLKRKGYNVFNENLLVMPANVAIRYDDNLVKQLYDTALRKVKKMAEEIINNKKKLQKNNIVLKIFSYLFSKSEGLGAQYFGRFLKISDECNNCNLCLKNCPTGNIYKVNDEIRFDKKCTFCMRCVYLCPKKAISNKYFNLFIIKEGYNIINILKKPNIKGNYISNKTKGYFKHFYRYFIQD
ncbi:MAG: EFR1 family ferrodoxin [Promethearchaeota archaeon]